jgi:1,4-alpha-glucan branching enzyme
MKLLPSDKGTVVCFELSAEPGSQVFVAGTFNNWNPTANPLTDYPDRGHFKAAVPVSPGVHEYKFVVNGVWTADPKCPAWAPNGHGGANNVFRV